MNKYSTFPVGFTDDDLAELWIRKFPRTKYSMERFLRYENGIWQEINEDLVKNEIFKILVENKGPFLEPTKSKLNSILELSRIQIILPNEIWDQKKDILICKNGALNLKTGELLNHSPDYYAITGIPHDYDPNAKAPNFSKVLERLDGDVVHFLQEFAGYCLTLDTQHDIALWLYGPPASGKSSFIEGLQAMLGRRTCVIGLSSIEKSRFALGSLPGKSLIVSTESPSINISQTDILNSIISGDRITIEIKFKDPFDHIPGAKIVWAMNDLPTISSTNNGIFRRVKIIYFPAIPEDEQDPKIRQGIKIEGQGILNWAVEGYKRLYKRGFFEVPKSIVSATEEYRLSLDHIRDFLDEECVVDPNANIKSSLIYDCYKSWCTQNGYKFKNNRDFGKELEKIRIFRKKLNDGNYWEGVRLK